MCKICNRTDRADIENAILNISVESGLTIDSIAEQYQLDVAELRNHALFHTPLVAPCDVVTQTTELQLSPDAEAKLPASLARKMKLREADTLATVNNEYLVTLKAMGRRINRLTSVSSIDAEDEAKRVELAKLLTKPMVDLYIGLGGEIRQNVKALAEVDRMLNGPQDSGSNGLIALAEAIKGSGGDNQ
jgi:hypothetical protein